MIDKLSLNLAAFERFVIEKGWSIHSQKDIEYGRQVIVTDGIDQFPINFYYKGAILPQGNSGVMKTAITAWVDLRQNGGKTVSAVSEKSGRKEIELRNSYTAKYIMENPEARNVAARWLYAQIDKQVLDFLYPNDRNTLMAAALVRNAFENSAQILEDYWVIVMPFAKPYEGFLIKLAVHLGLTTEEALSQKSKTIVVGEWLEAIKTRLPDIKRYAEAANAIITGWDCRCKAIHSDPAYDLKTLESFSEADREISIILRAIDRGYRVFVGKDIKLKPGRFHRRETRKRDHEPEPETENV